MSEALLEPPVRANDRLLLTIVIAAAVHAMVVLGVRLPPEAPVKSRFSAMEVVLVPAPATVATVAPAADEPPLLPMAPVEQADIKAAPAPVIAPVEPAPVPMPAPRTSSRPTPKPRAPTPIPAPTVRATPSDAPAAATPGDTPTAKPDLPLPSAAQLIERSLAIAATGAGLIEDRTVSGQSVSERTLYIKNNSRDLTEMAYAEQLRNKAKRFGELFERDVPGGRVGLDVAVASDGSLANVTVTRSSGIEATDAKAVHIVEKAAPYAPLPPEMAKKYDVAHIDFTMNIVDDQGFNHGQ